MATALNAWRASALVMSEMAEAVSNVAFLHRESNWNPGRSRVKANKAREARRIKTLRRKQGRI